MVEAGRGLKGRGAGEIPPASLGSCSLVGDATLSPPGPPVLAQGKGGPGGRQSCAICEPGTGVAVHSELQEAEGPGVSPTTFFL